MPPDPPVTIATRGCAGVCVLSVMVFLPCSWTSRPLPLRREQAVHLFPRGPVAEKPVRRGRGRRPAAQVRAGVLAAAAELLFEGGLPAVTFEKVAARAGASKTTLYKW